MKKALFLFGLFVIFAASLLWVSSSPRGFYRLESGEFLSLFVMGVLLMLPLLVSAARTFFSSGARDDPF